MNPSEILTAKKYSGCVFIPISPCYEWHSFHLPVGTDALISERICELVAEKIGGVYFKALSLGVDAIRSESQLLQWGFKKNAKIFGMNFPEISFFSEYCTKKEMVIIINNRLRAVKETGFKIAFIVNNHGGVGQQQILEKICSKWNSKNFKVEYISTGKFCTINNCSLNIGGHAGLSETHRLMAFRPDLVDIVKLPKNNLKVCKTGILHNKPMIEEQYHPKNVSKTLSANLRENIINNFVTYIQKNYFHQKKAI
ncbi:MAG: creatininase family protein [Candidatus Firestonebacteria bacterium]